MHNPNSKTARRAETNLAAAKLMATMLLCAGIFPSKAQTIGKAERPIDFVSTLVGTMVGDRSGYFVSVGNTYPATAMPWGMHFWTPQTEKMNHQRSGGWFNWPYIYTAEKIRGFKQTHQPSPWVNDYGQFAVMPMVGKKTFDEDERASYFSHKTETAKPHYYAVYLASHNVRAEVTPSERAAYFRFTFPKTDQAYVLLDAFDQGSSVEVIPAERKIIGHSTKHSRGGGVPDNFRNYFVLQFDRPFENVAVFADSALADGRYRAQADHVGAIVGFRTAENGEQILLKVASSFISPEQAERNLKELDGTDFDQRVAMGEDIWNKTLGRIEIEGGSIDDMRTFYSALYRSLLFPRMFYEIDADGQIVHYSPYNGQVLPGYLFTDTGFWDTFRALFPFLNLMYPEMALKMQDGLANAYREGGWLPEWASPGYRNVMVGNNSASVVADAWIKGVRSKDIETLYEALKKGADNPGPMEAVGRAGAEHYRELGYVPMDAEIHGSAARTLDYAYDDFTIYQLAKALGKPQSELEYYKKRAFNYRNLYDPETGMMRGRNRDGSFQTPFSPFKWDNPFVEGNSWHYTWSVFQDVEGLAKLMGGHLAMEAKMDSVFTLPPVFGDPNIDLNTTSISHEMREMLVAGMGQYAHGNQPIQHMIYLYNHIGTPWKTQYWVREAMKRLYSPHPDGYCGDEDNGQTSVWYVFSALGFYPVTPAVDEYALGAPLFRKATLHLANGKKVVIRADDNSAANRYVHALKWNGKNHTKNYVRHSELLKGGTLRFDMRDQPNKTRGTKREDLPFSMSND